MSGGPRVLFVGRGRITLPLPAWLARKWDAVADELDIRVLGAATPGSRLAEGPFLLTPPFSIRLLDGMLFHLRLPWRVRDAIRRFDPAVVVASDPYVGSSCLLGRWLSGRRPKLIVEVHGDWHTFTRGYGNPARRLLSPIGDQVAAFALRRADATRALSAFTSSLIAHERGRPASAAFPTYSDLRAFSAMPPRALPERPSAVFVGMLEAYKNVDGLAAAWRRVAAELPEAKLVVIGKGTRRAVIDELVRDLPDSVEHHLELPPEEVAAAIDGATVLVLPSWPEGLGRVIIEAFARGRGVVATGAGGVLDLVEDGEQGILIPPADTDALVDALRRVLTDRGLAEQLGEAARRRFAGWNQSADDFAHAQRALVDAVIAGRTR